MNIIIFDTETTDLNKCFCYNIGYVIANTETKDILVKKDFVVEQIWHNLPLFSTAYYADKRPIYVNRMRAKQTKMAKYGYICQEIIRDIKKYDVVSAYAYNSPFDEKVFNFNCDWFKCINPFDTIPVFDVRGFVHCGLVDNDYIAFCESNSKFTESGNYSTTAETVFQYLINDVDFTEEHTALSDSIIEFYILMKSVEKGGLNLLEQYQVKRSITRNVEKILTVQTKDKAYKFKCNGYTVSRSKDLIKLK